MFGSSGSAEKSGSSVLILMVACLILNTYEYILCYLSRCPFLGALLNEDIVMVADWMSIRSNDTTRWSDLTIYWYIAIPSKSR